MLAKLGGLSWMAVLVMGAFCALIYYLFFLNGLDQNPLSPQALKTHLEKGTKRLEDSKRFVDENAQAKETLKATQTKLEELQKKLPTEYSNAEFLVIFQDILKSIGNTECTLDSRSSEEPEAQEAYLEYKMDVEIRCPFNEITSFLYQIASLEKIVKIGDFHFVNSRDINRSPFLNPMLLFTARFSTFKSTPLPREVNQ